MNYSKMSEAEFKYLLYRAKKFMHYNLFYSIIIYSLAVLLITSFIGLMFFDYKILQLAKYYINLIPRDLENIIIWINSIVKLILVTAKGLALFSAIRESIHAIWNYYCNSTRVYYINHEAREFISTWDGRVLWWLGWIVQVFIFSHINTYMGQIPLALIPDIIYRFIYNNNAKNDYICGKGIKIFEGETIAHVYILDNGMEKEISAFSLISI